MSQEVDDLVAKVAAEDTVIDSAVAFIAGIRQQLTDLAAQLAAQGVDVSKITALSADIGTKTDALSAAIATTSDGTTPAPTGDVPTP